VERAVVAGKISAGAAFTKQWDIALEIVMGLLKAAFRENSKEWQ